MGGLKEWEDLTAVFHTTTEIRKWRGYLHRLIDKHWKTSQERKEVYSKITQEIGCQYHTAEIRSVDEAKRIYAICKNKLNFLLDFLKAQLQYSIPWLRLKNESCNVNKHLECFMWLKFVD